MASECELIADVFRRSDDIPDCDSDHQQLFTSPPSTENETRLREGNTFLDVAHMFSSQRAAVVAIICG